MICRECKNEVKKSNNFSDFYYCGFCKKIIPKGRDSSKREDVKCKTCNYLFSSEGYCGCSSFINDAVLGSPRRLGEAR